MHLWIKTLLLYTMICTCHNANILIYIPAPFYSHHVTYRPLFKELANRGHQLTMITPNPMKTYHNITQIDVSEVYQFLEENKFYELITSGEQSFGNVMEFFRLVSSVVNIELANPEVQQLIQGNGSFDLVLTEYLLTAGAAFAHRFQCPLIGLSSMDATNVKHQLVGNPTHPVLYPPQDAGFAGKPTLKQRFASTFLYLAWFCIERYLRKGEDLHVKRHFGADAPSLDELEKHISFLFINSNPVFHTVRPLGLQTINLGGGLHIEPPKPLPKEFEDFLNNSKKGVIYFSLGSSIRASNLNPKSKSVIVKVLEQLPYDILWKFEKDENDTFIMPKNVQTSKWVPQQDFLRHPKVKCFITQGGLQSLEESLYAGVPVLVMPFFGDQFQNAEKAVKSGIGLELDHKSLEIEQFKRAILDLIKSDKYKNNALRLAKQFQDQPMTSLQKAVWWTEYALRNRNVDVLKNPNIDLPLYQYLFLDITFCCLVTLASLIWLLLKILCLVRMFFARVLNKVKKD